MKQITQLFLEGESPTLIVLGAYAIRWPKCARSYFKTENDAVQNLIDDFFLTLTVIGPFHRKDFKWKKYGGTRLISEKMEVLHANLWKSKSSHQ